ncbi:type II toxin-antitoxin system YafQ family toxin [Burkholderia sp. TSV86]|uniref:type II toxin-antitoxin system YafQ family toxin n=1 Tax=Burkholderia sp. TSV86 TaxID=1385594 RepID=UPI00075DD3AA|nr:type II toxin-antitoxin system mRNA interferase toxin, RelE/StbE family [Burkholderia sp. TSV86]KVE38577.1 damage-inducible protein [Burkholderia sp. TSV86]
MLEPRLSNAFKRDVKRAQKRGKDTTKLRRLMQLLLDQQPLPPTYRDHPLKGAWAGYRDAHVEPDWLLLYRVEPRAIYFVRTGTHADLFGE